MLRETFMEKQDKKFLKDVIATISDLGGSITAAPKRAAHPSTKPYFAKVEMDEAFTPEALSIIDEMAKERALIEHPLLTYRTSDGIIQCYDLDCIRIEKLTDLLKDPGFRNSAPMRLRVAKTSGKIAGWAARVNSMVCSTYIRGRYDEFIDLYNAALAVHHPGQSQLLINRR